MVKVIAKNFILMPLFIKFLFGLGLVAPFLVIFSLITGKVEEHYSLELINNSIDFITLGLVFSCVTPLFGAAVMMSLKIKISRAIYIIGLITVSLSPLLIAFEKIDKDKFLIEFIFNLLLGLIIFIYLYKNNEAKNYFEINGAAS